jgi:hypothetical protein
MQLAHLQQMLLQPRHQALGQQCQPVLAALPVAHRELTPLNIHILDPQPQRLHQSEAAAVQQPHHQGRLSLQSLAHRPHLRFAEHHRQPAPCPCPHHTLQLQVALQQLPVQKQQRRQRLILGGGTDLQVHRQVAQEGVHLGAAHLARVAPAVKPQESPQHCS